MSIGTPPPAMAFQSPLLREAVDRWLRSQCTLVPGTKLGAVLLRGTQGMRLIACVPSGQPAPSWFAEAAAAAVEKRQRLVVSHGSADGAPTHAVANPLLISGMVVGASVVMLDSADSPSAAQCAALDANAGNFNVDMPAPERDGQQSIGARRILDLLDRTTACRSLREAADMLATTMATTLDCDRVTLGLRSGQRTSLVGSSDGWHDGASALQADVCSAMDEAMDAAGVVVVPPPDGHDNWLVAAHAHLSESREARALCTVPLVGHGAMHGALLAERRHGQPFRAQERDWIAQAMKALTPWLVQRQELDLPPWRRLRDSLAGMCSSGMAGRHRLALLAGALASALVLGWPVDSEVGAPVKLEGSSQRIITAPVDSFVQQVHVRPGDIVRAGDPLVDFAAEDLRVERERLVAELAGNDAAAGDAMARQDMGALALRQAKADENKAQLALLDQRLSRARITAPFDAVVIQGDLRDVLGAPSKRGDALLTLAPVGSYRAVAEVDDVDIGAIAIGQRGEMVLTAMPDRSIRITVKQVTPLAVVAPGRSFFEVEVALDTADVHALALRPGMRGIARIASERRTRAGAWWHDASRAVRLAWWRWVG